MWYLKKCAQSKVFGKDKLRRLPLAFYCSCFSIRDSGWILRLDLEQLKFLKYKNPLVRELAWIIGSRPLMSEHGYCSVYQTLDDKWINDLLEESESFLVTLDLNSTPLRQWLEVRPSRLLGIRFESMLGFFFENHPRFEMLANNVQLKNGTQTVGEIDFIVNDLTHNRTLHVEVACKFYLSSKNSHQWNLWLGPNPNDTLKLKMDKMVDQLSITTRYWGKEYLQSQKFANPEPTLLMKGAFHHHYSMLGHAKHPKFSNTKYNSGWWCHQKELKALNNVHIRWAELEKESWLCPQIRVIDETLDFECMQKLVDDHFSRSKRSILLTCLFDEDGFWIEHSRGFVVKNEWPG